MSDTLIKVRPDGSGTIEQTLMVNPKTFESLALMVSQMAGGADARPSKPELPSPKDILDEAKLKEAATRFGSGVRYVSSTQVKNGDLEGGRAIFAFDDINTLNVTQGPSPGATTHSDRMRFRLDRRPGGSVLVVTMNQQSPAPDPGQADKGAGAAPQMPPEAMAMVKPMLQDLHMVVALDVDGTLVRTDAEHVKGNRITLLDLDFGPLLESPAAFEQLTRVRPGTSMDELTPLLKGLPGVTVNSRPSLTVEFK
jgi:hypothetical protein